MEIALIVLASCSVPLGGIFLGYLSMRMKHEERKIELTARRGQETSESMRHEIAELRQEMMRLRDTSTQYDLSLQKTLEETQHRLTTLESRSRGAIPATSAQIDEAPLQKNGLG